ncbi:MAG: flagellar motor switch protein FliG [Alkalispirochaeta sp.]
MENRKRAAGAYQKHQGLFKSGSSESKSTRNAESKEPPLSDARGKHDSSAESPPPRGREGAAPAGSGARREPPVLQVRDGQSLREVAQFLTLIGREQAASVLRKMPEDQAKLLIDAMAHVDTISPAQARKILTQFGARRQEVTHEVAGGPDAAREILIRAFGAEHGERRFYEILPDERPRRFSFLDDADGRQLSIILRNESPATMAIILANVSQATGARLLQALPVELKTHVVRRLATMGTVDASVLDAVEQTLRKKVEAIERPADDEIDGEQRLAQILRYLDLSTSDAILEDLSVAVPDSADHIRRQMTSIEDVFYLGDRDLQEVLKRIDDVDLAVVLKGKSPELEKRLMSQISGRRGEMVAMHRESLGPMHRRDVDRVTGEFVELVRSMARAGEIVIQRTDEEYI